MTRNCTYIDDIVEGYYSVWLFILKDVVTLNFVMTN